MKRTLILVGLLALAACSPTTTTTAASTTTTARPTTTTARPTTTSVVVTMPAPTSLPSLSEAFCNDLRAGMSPLAIYKGVERSYSGPKEFADRAYGMAALSCPEQLKTNQALRSLLTGWGINPDA